jgi:uncharacterized protein
MALQIEKEKTSVITVTKTYLQKNVFYILPIAAMSIVVIGLIMNHAEQFSINNIISNIDLQFWIYLLIGVIAQLVDGTLGMGYGATSTSFLLASGVPPAVSSTAVHVAEMFTTGASAISHQKFGNINKKLARYLILPGVIGSVIGAYLLSDLIDGNAIKPYVAAYMVILATLIIRKGLKKEHKKKKVTNLGGLALFGGFMDAIGGGGWGPIVTSSLIGKGRDPKYTIASVNAAEFAVAFASGITFLLFTGISGWQVIIALILGGVIAAPFSGYLINVVPRRSMTVIVGILLVVISLRTLLLHFHII